MLGADGGVLWWGAHATGMHWIPFARRFSIVVDSSIVKVCATPRVIEYEYEHALIGCESGERMS